MRAVSSSCRVTVPIYSRHFADSPALCRNPVAPQEQIDCDVLLDMAGMVYSAHSCPATTYVCIATFIPFQAYERIIYPILFYTISVLLMKEYAEAMGYAESSKYVCTCSYIDERLKAKWIMMVSNYHYFPYNTEVSLVCNHHYTSN